MTTNAKIKTEGLTDIGLKREITIAGRIMSDIAPQLKAYEAHLKRIKHELLQRIELPADTIAMVSGEYIATYSAEKKARDITPAVLSIIIDDIGMTKFLGMASVAMAKLKTEYTADELETLAPAEFTGSGRSFKLSERS